MQQPKGSTHPRHRERQRATDQEPPAKVSTSLALFPSFGQLPERHSTILKNKGKSFYQSSLVRNPIISKGPATHKTNFCWSNCNYESCRLIEYIRRIRLTALARCWCHLGSSLGLVLGVGAGLAALPRLADRGG